MFDTYLQGDARVARYGASGYRDAEDEALDDLLAEAEAEHEETFGVEADIVQVDRVAAVLQPAGLMGWISGALPDFVDPIHREAAHIAGNLATVLREGNLNWPDLSREQKVQALRDAVWQSTLVGADPDAYTALLSAWDKGEGAIAGIKAVTTSVDDAYAAFFKEDLWDFLKGLMPGTIEQNINSLAIFYWACDKAGLNPYEGFIDGINPYISPLPEVALPAAPPAWVSREPTYGPPAVAEEWRWVTPPNILAAGYLALIGGAFAGLWD